MKRRSLLAATGSLPLAGFAGLSSAEADAVTRETDPIRVADETIEFGGVTASIGSARLAHDGKSAVFEGSEWTATDGEREVSLGSVTVTVENVSSQSYAQIRDSIVESADGGSLSPILTGVARADVNPSAPVVVRVGPIASDRGTLADEALLTGTVGEIVPDNRAAFVTGESDELGGVEFEHARIVRGDHGVSAAEIVASPVPAGLLITSVGVYVEAPEVARVFRNVNATVRPPEERVDPQASAFDGLRRLAADESLTASAIRATIAESGASLDNTIEAVRNTTYEATGVSVNVEDGESTNENFSRSGTLAELIEMVRRAF